MLISVFLVFIVADRGEIVAGEDDTVGDLAAGEGDGLVFIGGHAAKFEVALLHALYEGYGEILHHRAAFVGNHLVVLTDGRTLIAEYGAGSLAAFVDYDGGNGKFAFGGEICGGIVDGNADRDLVVDDGENLGDATYADIGGGVSHLLCGILVAGSQGRNQSGDCENLGNFHNCSYWEYKYRKKYDMHSTNKEAADWRLLYT